jgi:hypothetical protein
MNTEQDLRRSTRISNPSYKLAENREIERLRSIKIINRTNTIKGARTLIQINSRTNASSPPPIPGPTSRATNEESPVMAISHMDKMKVEEEIEDYATTFLNTVQKRRKEKQVTNNNSSQNKSDWADSSRTNSRISQAHVLNNN